MLSFPRVIGRMTRQGLPAAKERGGMSLVTTLTAPITEPSPIVTPGQTTTLAPNVRGYLGATHLEVYIKKNKVVKVVALLLALSLVV